MQKCFSATEGKELFLLVKAMEIESISMLEWNIWGAFWWTGEGEVKVAVVSAFSGPNSSATLL